MKMEQKKCIICNNKLNGNKRKFCSSKCSRKYSYENNKKVINTNTYHRQLFKGISRKIKLLELRGWSGCENCGYFNNYAALDFHHKNEIEKEFSLDMRTLSNKSWNKILNEFEKCAVLCSNCHREHHNPELLVTNDEFKYNERIKKFNSCLDCQKIIDNKAYRCKECNDKSKRKAERPDKDFLLKEIAELGYSAVGRKYGVSDNAIRKWLKR